MNMDLHYMNRRAAHANERRAAYERGVAVGFALGLLVALCVALSAAYLGGMR